MKLDNYLESLRFIQSGSEIEFLSTKSFKSNLDFLESVFQQELTARQARSLELRAKAAKLGLFKKHNEFLWHRIQGITEAQFRILSQLRFIDEKENIIFFGACGLGKTMLAKNLMDIAINRGFTARFYTAADLLLSLRMIDSPTKQRNMIKRLSRIDLLIIDELGYTSHTDAEADLLFHILNLRHECKPTIITTNLGFEHWTTFFSNAASVHAIVDRIIHHCQIFHLKGSSYRFDESLKRKALTPEAKDQ